MKFRNYCLIVIGNTVGITIEINKISETVPAMVDGKGLFIATFSSAMTPSELTDWFKLCKRSFFIFDLSETSAGWFVDKVDTHEGLFNFLKSSNLDDKSSDLLREILQTADTKSQRVRAKPVTEAVILEKVFTEKEIEKMYKKDRENLFDEIIDKGVDNLSENDKKTLAILAKY